MRNALILCIILSVAACAQPGTQDTLCTPPEIPDEFGCCMDSNDNMICDSREDLPEPEPEVTENITEPEPEDTEVVENETEEQASLTEQYEETFWQRTDSFSYYIESDYGDLWVWVQEDTITYITVENLLWVRNRDVSTSQYHYLADDERLINAIEDRAYPLINYIVYDRETDRYTGCYIDRQFYRLENCIEDHPNNNPVIHYELRFEPPLTPLDHLAAHVGKEPESVLEGRIFRTATTQLRVDHLVFRNSDGSQERLYIHSRFKVPLQVDSIRGGTTESIAFEEPAFRNPDAEGIRLDPSRRE